MPKPKANVPIGDPEDSGQTLEDLAKQLGPPDAGLLEAILDGADEAKLLDAGRSIASSRILVDVRRLYPAAYSFWTRATAPQQETLRGFSLELLSVAVHQAISLDAMNGAHDEKGHRENAEKAKKDAALREEYGKAIVLRDQAARILRQVAGDGKGARAELEKAVGTAEDEAALIRGLRALGDMGMRLLGQKSGPVATRAKLLRCDADYVASLHAAANALEKATKDADARPGRRRVDQVAIDRSDGINLRLLEFIMDAFDSAHDVDSTIPRLVPISTRRMFSKGSSGKVAAKKKITEAPPNVEPG